MSQSKTLNLRVVLAGGTTAGPIIPLLAVREEILTHHPEAHFFVADSRGSVGEMLAKQQHLEFWRIHTGKLRRYLSWRTIFTPLLVIIGFIQSLYLLKKHHVTHVVGAGGFVQVPLIWAAWLLRLRTHIHQQDIAPTLANTVCAPFAKTISVTFASSQRDFPQGLGLFAGENQSKIHLTGNPCQQNIFRASKLEAQKFFQLEPSWPTVYVLGGGSGALGINKLIDQALPELTRTVQVIHSTGRGRHHGQFKSERYHNFEYVDRPDLAFAAADIVVARAGISTVTELSNLGKASIIIPMPHTHQEINAQLLFEQQAAIVLDQTETTSDHLVRTVRRLLFDLPTQNSLRENIKKIMPHNAARAVTKLVLHE